MNLGSRISKAIELSETTAPDLSRATGVSSAAINALMRRDSRRSEFTEQLLTGLNPQKVNLDWVRTGHGTPDPINKGSALASQGVEETNPEAAPQQHRAAHLPRSTPVSLSVGLATTPPLKSWEHPERLPEGGWVLIPKWGILQPGARGEIKTVHMTEELQAFRTPWIRELGLDPSALGWLEAADNSAAPVICEGDTYVVDASQKNVIDGKVYAVVIGGTATARRLHHLPGGGLRLKPINPDFDQHDLSSADLNSVQILGRVVNRQGRGGL